MSDIDEQQQSETVRIVGGDEAFVADVIEEDGLKKLLVKSSIVPQVLGHRFSRYARDAALSIELNVNGSNTPIEFIVNSDATGDMIVSSLVWQCFAGGIKLDKFLSLNSELPTGLIVEVKSENVIFNFLAIRNTMEFDSLFAYGNGRSFEVISASGNDSLVSRFGPTAPFLLKKTGTYTIDDYIKVTVADNISSISRIRFLAEGNIDL